MKNHSKPDSSQDLGGAIWDNFNFMKYYLLMWDKILSSWFHDYVGRDAGWHVLLSPFCMNMNI